MIVFGAGAIGSLFAALLTRAGDSVLVVGPPAHVRAIREGGLRVEGSLEGTWPMEAEEGLTAPVPADAVLLTVKSFDLVRAAEGLAPWLERPMPILLPQNGLGITARAKEGFAAGVDRPSHWFVRAVNTLPATLVAPGQVRYAGSGEVRLPSPTGSAGLGPAIRLFHDLLARAKIPVRYVSNFDQTLWTKAVVNGVINPITAAHGVMNGALATSPYRELAEALLAEGLAAAGAAGHPLDASATREELWRTVGATATNRSSMLQDVERGRPTEIDVISGALLAAGRAHGFPMPATADIVTKVRARVATAGQRS